MYECCVYWVIQAVRHANQANVPVVPGVCVAVAVQGLSVRRKAHQKNSIPCTGEVLEWKTFQRNLKSR